MKRYNAHKKYEYENKGRRYLHCECGYVAYSDKEYFSHLDKCGLRINRLVSQPYQEETK